MKTNKKHFFIIVAILVFSFFSVSISSFNTDTSTKTITEISFEDVLKKDKDDKIAMYSFITLTSFHENLKNSLYVKSSYSYLDTNQLLRPPIFI